MSGANTKKSNSLGGSNPNPPAIGVQQATVVNGADASNGSSSSNSPSNSGSSGTTTGTSHTDMSKNGGLAFSPAQLQQLQVLFSSMLQQQQKSPSNGIQSTATPAAGSSTSLGMSYSSAVGAGTSTRITSAASLFGSFGLYGNSDRSRDSFPVIKPLPKTADSEVCEAWTRDTVNKMTNSGGMKQVVTLSANESLARAIQEDGGVHTPEQVERVWRNCHEKACSVLRDGFFPALGDTPALEAERQQALNPSEFIKDNANFIWTYALSQFKPDPLGKVVKAYRALESLKFIPAKMTPVEYNAAYRTAFNDIQSADPTQNFTVTSQLGYYIKGWGPELHQKLELLKSDSNPTVHLAQRLLQQWYDDNGKKHKSKPEADPTPTPTPTSPAPAASSLSALKEQQQAAWEKAKELSRAVRAAQKKKYRYRRYDSSSDSESDERKPDSPKPRKQVSFGSLLDGVNGILPTSNKFAALSQDEDEKTDAPLGAISADGREIFNTRNEFLLDSGASRNVVYDRQLISNPEPLKTPIVMTCASGKPLLLNEYGNVRLSESVTLNNVCHAKGAKINAMSVARITDHGYVVIFGKKGAAVIEADVVEGRLRHVSPDKKVLTVPRVGDIYVYTRPGTELDPNEPKPPSLEINRSGQIPLRGNAPGASSSAPRVPRPPAPAAASAPPPPPPPRSAPVSSPASAQPAGRASVNAMTVAATLKEYGLPPDTDVDYGQWYGLHEHRQKSL